jgi:DNA-binding NarL/FixJ family response regulator
MATREIYLPPREVTVLRLLLSGAAEKQMARTCELSVHTIHSYVKALYRRFGVASRAELMALWIDQTEVDRVIREGTPGAAVLTAAR